MNAPSTFRPFIFTVVEDNGVDVTIEVSEEDYKADLAAGIDEEATMKPGRYKFKRGGFLERHPELKADLKKELKVRVLIGAYHARASHESLKEKNVSHAGRYRSTSVPNVDWPEPQRILTPSEGGDGREMPRVAVHS